MGFWAVAGAIVKKRASRATRVIEAQLGEDGPLESFDQAGVRIFFGQPTEGKFEQGVEGAEIGIRFGHLLDHLRKVSGGEESRIRLA